MERISFVPEVENEEYDAFIEKFKPKLTTDDCYTPPAVYDAVAIWVEKEYGVNRENFVRPFYPGGDYARVTYLPGQIVVDNPPFSILAEIKETYQRLGVPYFLFAPTLTLFSAPGIRACHIAVGVADACKYLVRSGTQCYCGWTPPRSFEALRNVHVYGGSRTGPQKGEEPGKSRRDRKND